MPRCIFSTLAATTDVRFLEQMLSHLSRQCNASIHGTVVFVDTAPLGPGYRDRPGVGTMADVDAIMTRLQGAGIIDDVVKIPYDVVKRRTLYRRHFGHDLRKTHDFRGYPIYGSLYALDSLDADLIVHFDADMLLYQQPGHDWISVGKDLLERRDDVMFVAPLSGPPGENGNLRQRGVSYCLDPNGFYSFKEFTSRKFLMDWRRLKELLPIRPQYISAKRRLWQAVSGKSALWNWEIMISRALHDSRFLRADLAAPSAWTLHTPDHGDKFIQHLDTIIAKVEAGWYPPQQAGDYDLRLDDWINP